MFGTFKIFGSQYLEKKVNIPWKLKSKIFQIIDIFNMPSVLYFLQKNVTKRSRVKSLEVDEMWERHKKSLVKYSTTGLVFEFGAGKNLAQNIFLSGVVDQQLVVDLNAMIDLKLVNTARNFLSEIIQLRSKENIKTNDDLQNYGITYKAPYDAAKTDLKDKSIDACISSVTLEHVPKESIVQIFTELRRTLREDGIVSATIDYSDHYAHTDPTISLLNYLRYPDFEWDKYNHSCHYQNRLRHYDYKKIFSECGFQILEEEVFYQENQIPDELKKEFFNKDPSWCATSSYVVLKKIGC